MPKQYETSVRTLSVERNVLENQVFQCNLPANTLYTTLDNANKFAGKKHPHLVLNLIQFTRVEGLLHIRAGNGYMLYDENMQITVPETFVGFGLETSRKKDIDPLLKWLNSRKETSLNIVVTPSITTTTTEHTYQEVTYRGGNRRSYETKVDIRVSKSLTYDVTMVGNKHTRVLERILAVGTPQGDYTTINTPNFDAVVDMALEHEPTPITMSISEIRSNVNHILETALLRYAGYNGWGKDMRHIVNKVNRNKYTSDLEYFIALYTNNPNTPIRVSEDTLEFSASMIGFVNELMAFNGQYVKTVVDVISDFATLDHRHLRKDNHLLFIRDGNKTIIVMGLIRHNETTSYILYPEQVIKT